MVAVVRRRWPQDKNTGRTGVAGWSSLDRREKRSAVQPSEGQFGSEAAEVS